MGSSSGGLFWRFFLLEIALASRGLTTLVVFYAEGSPAKHLGVVEQGQVYAIGRRFYLLILSGV